MVANAPHIPPPLSRDDEYTLTIFFSLQFNLLALALHLKRPPLPESIISPIDMVDWSRFAAPTRRRNDD